MSNEKLNQTNEELEMQKKLVDQYITILSNIKELIEISFNREDKGNTLNYSNLFRDTYKLIEKLIEGNEELLNYIRENFVSTPNSNFYPENTRDKRTLYEMLSTITSKKS